MNKFIWQNDVDICGIFIRFAIIQLGDNGKFGACVAQMFAEEEFIMVDAKVFDTIKAASQFISEGILEGNIVRLGNLQNELVEEYVL